MKVGSKKWKEYQLQKYLEEREMKQRYRELLNQDNG